MARRFTCKLDGFSVVEDSERMIQHVEDAHGIRYKVSTDEQERLKSLAEWTAWWEKNITIETVHLIAESKEE